MINRFTCRSENNKSSSYLYTGASSSVRHRSEPEITLTVLMRIKITFGSEFNRHPPQVCQIKLSIWLQPDFHTHTHTHTQTITKGYLGGTVLGSWSKTTTTCIQLQIYAYSLAARLTHLEPGSLDLAASNQMDEESAQNQNTSRRRCPHGWV